MSTGGRSTRPRVGVFPSRIVIALTWHILFAENVSSNSEWCLFSFEHIKLLHLCSPSNSFHYYFIQLVSLERTLPSMPYCLKPARSLTILQNIESNLFKPTCLVLLSFSRRRACSAFWSQCIWPFEESIKKTDLGSILRDLAHPFGSNLSIINDVLFATSASKCSQELKKLASNEVD